MKMLGEILNEKPVNDITVNSIKKYKPTVNSNNNNNSETVAYKIEKIIEESGIKPEGVGKMLSEGLDDAKSERYYTLLASENSVGKLLEALHWTKDADRRGAIKTKKALYFRGILIKMGMKIKFKRS